MFVKLTSPNTLCQRYLYGFKCTHKKLHVHEKLYQVLGEALAKSCASYSPGCPCQVS